MNNSFPKLIITFSLVVFYSVSYAQNRTDLNELKPKPKIIYQENFQSYSKKSKWRSLPDTEVVSGCGRGRDQCLRVSYRPVNRGSPVIETRVPIPSGTHYHLSYHVLFEPGFEFVKGGKLPGLAPIKQVTGCLPERPDGWSARIMWKPNGAVMAYYYSQKRKNRCGDGEVSKPFVFKPGVWQLIELEMKLNSTAMSRDALVRVSVDGELVSQSAGFRFRATDDAASQISHFLFSTFYGGNDPSWSPAKTRYIQFDNFTVKDLGHL